MPDDNLFDAPMNASDLPRFVRVLDTREGGLVSFEFAIGWPELCVELMLPEPAFAEFCARQKAQPLDA